MNEDKNHDLAQLRRSKQTWSLYQENLNLIAMDLVVMFSLATENLDIISGSDLDHLRCLWNMFCCSCFTHTELRSKSVFTPVQYNYLEAQ